MIAPAAMDSMADHNTAPAEISLMSLMPGSNSGFMRSHCLSMALFIASRLITKAKNRESMSHSRTDIFNQIPSAETIKRITAWICAFRSLDSKTPNPLKALEKELIKDVLRCMARIVSIQMEEILFRQLDR